MTFLTKLYLKGFRDIYQKLLEEYNYFPKIPTCNQNVVKNCQDDESKKKERQLNVVQTNETRYVTKVILFLIFFVPT